MNSRRIITFLHAKEEAFFWRIDDFYPIENGVEAKANDNYYLRILFHPKEGFKVVLMHYGLIRKKLVKRLSRISPFDLHDAISNILAFVSRKHAA